MNNFWKRLAAYIIDIFIVFLIVSIFTNNSYTNPQLDKYNELYDEYEELLTNYSDFTTDLEEYFSSDEIEEIGSEEYDELVEKYPSYQEELDKYYQDESLTKDNYEDLLEDVNEEFESKYKVLYLSLSKNYVVYDIVYIVAILIYFIGFNMITEGQTLGKKLFGLKIVNNKDYNKKVKWYNYLIRSTILYNPVYYLALVIGAYIFTSNSYYWWALVWSNIQNYLLLLLMLMIIWRRDGRGLHDFLSNTRVVSIDKNGNVIENKINNIDTNNKEDIIDEEFELEENMDNDKEKDDKNNNITKKKNTKKKVNNTKKKKIVIDEEK